MSQLRGSLHKHCELSRRRQYKFTNLTKYFLINKINFKITFFNKCLKTTKYYNCAKRMCDTQLITGLLFKKNISTILTNVI